MAKQDDSLFLLEVLVDKIVFEKSPCFADKEFVTCITISVPSVEPLEICDDHPGACTAQSGGPFVKQFNIGKSCLFSLTQSCISSAMSKFPIQVTVSKSLPCGCLPTKITMGETTIDMTKEFVQARNNFLADPSTVSYQAMKDSFRLLGPEKEAVGEIMMFLRISCLGKSVITKFQGSGGSTSVQGMGGGSGPSFVDRSCTPRKDFQSADDPCACGTASRAALAEAGKRVGMSGIPCSGGGVCPFAKDAYNSMPCTETDDPCFCSGQKMPLPQQMACKNTDQYCLHVPKGPSKQFEEIGTTVGENELKIKVPASASIIKKISQTHCVMQCPYVKGQGKDAGPCEPPCGKNQISLALPSEDTCCRGAQPATTQFTCTTEGCTQASKHGQQQLARGDNSKQDPRNAHVYVLKVAKTALYGDRKCKMELELVTPKGPDKKIPPQKKNEIMQADSQCLCCVKRLKKPIKKKKL